MKSPLFSRLTPLTLGLGIVLTELDESDHQRVISYASCTLPGREQNYTIMEKEELALLFATENFRVVAKWRSAVALTGGHMGVNRIVSYSYLYYFIFDLFRY